MLRKTIFATVAMICLLVCATAIAIFYCAFTRPTFYSPFGVDIVIDSSGYVAFERTAWKTIPYISPKVSAPVTIVCGALFVWWLSREIEEIKDRRRRENRGFPVEPPE